MARLFHIKMSRKYFKKTSNIIFWSESALNDLNFIYEYISKDSKINAEIFINSMFDFIDQLILFPYLGKRISEIENFNYRELLFKSYRIFYLITKEKIYILGIMHMSMGENIEIFKE